MHRLSVLFLLLSFNGLAFERNALPKYLSKTAIDDKTFLSQPPEKGSPEFNKDFEILLNYQKTRTESDCNRAKSEVHIALDTYFGPTYGPLSKEEVKKLNSFAEQVFSDADYFVGEIKKHFSRPRPYITNPKVKPCLPYEKTTAYPSGHTTLARVLGLVLSEWDPKRKSAFLKRADEIGNDRIIGGVHHPADIYAARKLADREFELLMQNTAFKKEIESLQ